MPEREDVLRRLATELRRVVVGAVVYNHRMAERLHLSPTDAQVLSLLELYGPMPAGRLAVLTRLTTGAITQAVDRLEAAKYVQRHRDPADRRKVIVTPDETALRDRVRPLFEPLAPALDRIHDRYGTDQLAVIADYLADLAAGRDAPDP
jgi:DNA-binding MarR family transcriptional regulator